MKLKFAYSIKTEVELVKYILERRKFFVKNNMMVNIPRGVNTTYLNNVSALKKVVSKELNKAKIEKFKHKILNDWKLKGELIKKDFESLPLEKPSEIEIVLSQYGCGGFYHTTINKISINIRGLKEPLEVLIHETVHNIIEKPLAERYNLTWEENERLTDYLMIKYFSNIFPKYEYRCGEPSEELLKKVGLE